MSSEKEKVLRVTVKDDASANILTIARSFRTMATLMRQTSQLTLQLVMVQTAESMSVARLIVGYRTLAMVKALATGFTLVGGLIAMAGVIAALQAGAPAMPVAQTARGGLPRQVGRTGFAMVHAGETISRNREARRGTGITININSANLRSTEEIEETARQLATSISFYDGIRRRRH